jgi:hypothetical protein
MMIALTASVARNARRAVAILAAITALTVGDQDGIWWQQLGERRTRLVPAPRHHHHQHRYRKTEVHLISNVQGSDRGDYDAEMVPPALEKWF